MKHQNCIRTLFASFAVSCSLFLGAAQIYPDGTVYKVDVDKDDEYTLSDADLVALKSGTYDVLQKLGGGDLRVSEAQNAQPKRAAQRQKQAEKEKNSFCDRLFLRFLFIFKHSRFFSRIIKIFSKIP